LAFGPKNIDDFIERVKGVIEGGSTFNKDTVRIEKEK